MTGGKTPPGLDALVRDAEAVIFDMDGVIVDSESVKFSAYRDVFQDRFGVTLDPSDVSWRGKPEPEVMKYWLAKLGLDHPDIPDLVRRKRARYRALIAQGRIGLIPGIEGFLRRLRSEGKKTGVATASTREDQEILFGQLGLGPSFDTVVTLEDVRMPKPAPEIYLQAAKNLGVAPGRCLVFEDSPTGVQAARAARMAVAVVLSSFPRAAFDPSLVSIDHFPGPMELAGW